MNLSAPAKRSYQLHCNCYHTLEKKKFHRKNQLSAFFLYLELLFLLVFCLLSICLAVIRTVSPGRHRPVMALTRAMAAKQAGQSSADVAASPDRFPRRYRYPSSSSSSSSSSTSNFSPPRTPTDLVSKDSSSCSSCISLSSHVQRLIDTIDTRFKEIYVQFEHVSNRLSRVEESISDQHSIINELERDLSIIADKLNKISSKNSDSVRSPSGTDKPQKSTQTNFNCSCSSSSLNKSQCISNYQSHPSPSTHATYTSFAHVPTPPPRTAVH